MPQFRLVVSSGGTSCVGSAVGEEQPRKQVSGSNLSGDERPYDESAGWTTLTEFLSQAEVAQTRAVCTELLELPVEQRSARDKPFAGTRHLNELDDRSEFIDTLLEREELKAVVTEILGASYRRDVVAYRSPQPSFGGQKLHADGPSKLTSGSDTVATAIIPLTTFTKDNGATRLIPGSHHRPDLQRQSGSLEDHPDQIFLTGAAGTAFVFSGHVLHSGTTNDSLFERPALHFVWRT